MPAALPALKLSSDQQRELQGIVRRRNEKASLVQRARLILLAAEGRSNRQIGLALQLKPHQVGVWRERFEEGGVAALRDQPRSGRPREMSDAQRRRICETACRKPPKHLARWSISSLAKHLRLPRNRVERALADADLHPHRLRTFTFSPDPNFGEKLLEVVGLYMSPPEHAVVLCVDEKTGIQALDRTQPMLPMKAGKPRSWTNEYVRHGTRTMLASLDIATGKVQAEVRDNRRSETFLKFMDAVVRENPDKDIHVVLDNLNTHCNAAARAWLEANPRVTFHYTPTHASWVNLIECFFSILTRQGLQQAVHRSAKELERFLKHFVNKYNECCGPFTWTKGPEKLKRLIQLTEEYQSRYAG